MTCCGLSHVPGENQRIVLHDKTWFLIVTPSPLKNGSRAPLKCYWLKNAVVVGLHQPVGRGVATGGPSDGCMIAAIVGTSTRVGRSPLKPVPRVTELDGRQGGHRSRAGVACSAGAAAVGGGDGRTPSEGTVNGGRRRKTGRPRQIDRRPRSQRRSTGWNADRRLKNDRVATTSSSFRFFISLSIIHCAFFNT